MTLLNSTGFVVGAYAFVAFVEFCVGGIECSRRRAGRFLSWPTFWFSTALLMLLMALGRASDTGQLLTELGRRRAHSDGWYDSRRLGQAIAVGAIAVTWCLVALVAIWRAPERRKRYLPSAIVTFALVCFAGGRVISLHQIDSILRRRQIGDLTVGNVIELLLLAVALVLAVASLAGAESTARPTKHERSEVSV